MRQSKLGNEQRARAKDEICSHDYDSGRRETVGPISHTRFDDGEKQTGKRRRTSSDRDQDDERDVGCHQTYEYVAE